MAIRKSSSKSSRDDPSCGCDNNPNDSTKISSTPPSRAELERVADLPVLDASRKSHKFRTLYSDKPKVLIVFIRHFFCGNCQEYLRTLASVLTPSSLLQLPTPTSIIVIGCGQPDLIPMYIKETSCPFPIYCDPTKSLYKSLGMTRTLDLGPRNPAYMQMSVPSAIVRSFLQALRAGNKMLSGGDFSQVGGEFLFEKVEDEGEEDRRAVTWCHRMRNTRDHAEFSVLKTELGYNGERPPVRKRWSTGLVRSLSNRRLSWKGGEERPRPGSMVLLDKLKEEPLGTSGAHVGVAA
ncbi:MAG: hypothetical protein Q9191_008091 [Dirinaria sp. TL-2023a]